MEKALAINLGETKTVHRKLDELMKRVMTLKDILNNTTTGFNENFYRIGATEGMMWRDLIYHKAEIRKVND